MSLVDLRAKFDDHAKRDGNCWTLKQTKNALINRLKDKLTAVGLDSSIIETPRQQKIPKHHKIQYVHYQNPCIGLWREKNTPRMSKATGGLYPSTWNFSNMCVGVKVPLGLYLRKQVSIEILSEFSSARECRAAHSSRLQCSNTGSTVVLSWRRQRPWAYQTTLQERSHEDAQQGLRLSTVRTTTPGSWEKSDISTVQKSSFL